MCELKTEVKSELEEYVDMKVEEAKWGFLSILWKADKSSILLWVNNLVQIN